MGKVNEKRLLKLFGRNIATLRRNKGLTQQELAEKADMNVVSIAYIETGKRWVRIGTLSKLAKILDVPAKNLFKGL